MQTYIEGTHLSLAFECRRHRTIGYVINGLNPGVRKLIMHQTKPSLAYGGPRRQRLKNFGLFFSKGRRSSGKKELYFCKPWFQRADETLRSSILEEGSTMMIHSELFVV